MCLCDWLSAWHTYNKLYRQQMMLKIKVAHGIWVNFFPKLPCLVTRQKNVKLLCLCKHFDLFSFGKFFCLFFLFFSKEIICQLVIMQPFVVCINKVAHLRLNRIELNDFLKIWHWFFHNFNFPPFFPLKFFDLFSSLSKYFLFSLFFKAYILKSAQKVLLQSCLNGF